MMSHELFTRDFELEFRQKFQDTIIITDPDVIKRIKAPIKLEILKMLKEKPSERGFTIKEIADALKKNPGTIKYHIDELSELGLVAIYKLEPTQTGIVQKFYKLTFNTLEIRISETLI